MEKRIVISVALAIVIGAAGLVSAQLLKKTPIDVFLDRETDFQALATYKWSDRQIPVKNRANHIRFVTAINREMESRRYKQDTVKPDMEILFELEVGKKLESNTTAGGTTWDPTNQRTNLAFDFYQEGTLSIIVFEADSYRRLWQATAQRRVGTPDRAEKEINEAVTALFKEFPVEPQPKDSKDKK